MEIKSLLAGLFLAFGLSNLLAVLGIPFSISLGIRLGGFDMGGIVLALLSLGIAYYLIKSR
ncbi:hypothetical protein KJ780_04405 [Candidatus Micrarchaeota archaeon]|nr:hypothetical protein [Candidatus Micrarchaeota archaeon]